MERGPGLLLLKCLDELTNENLSRFHFLLTSEHANDRGSSSYIPLGQIENATRHETVAKMMQKYGNEGAVKETLSILRMMNLNDMALRLESSIGEAHLSSSDSEARDPHSLESNNLKNSLVIKFERVLDGNSMTGHSRYLNDVFTDLYIVENETGGVIKHHDMRQNEAESSCRHAEEEILLKCSDIFKVQSETNRRNRKVLTMGIAGVGKTFSVNKLILDWAEGKENQDIDFIFPLPFWELNLKKDESLTLMELLHECVLDSIELTSLPMGDSKIMFIFDGLDECNFHLNFNDNEKLKDITKKTSVGSIVTNLIKKNLLPTALVWITSRPAASHLIPRDYIDQVTEMRGFNDSQKEEYFRKSCSNEELSAKIISCIKKSKSLYTMCAIPLFCRISITVLEEQFTKNSKTHIMQLNTTLTGMFSKFVLHQPARRKCYSQKGVLKLGKLAFHNLEKGDMTFYEENLKACGIDVTFASVYSGLCTQVYRQNASDRKVFSFVHLCVQEFLAALYVIHSHCKPVKRNVLKPKSFVNILKWGSKTMVDLHRHAIDKTLQSDNEHLNLFLTFLLGLSVEENQRELRKVFPILKITPENVIHTIKYIKEKLNSQISSEASLTLLNCLSEMGDQSFMSFIKDGWRPGEAIKQSLSPAQWSALAFVLQMQGETHKRFEMKMFSQPHEGFKRLLPVIKNTRQALLDNCNLNSTCCKDLASILSEESALVELDLSENVLQDSGVKMLSDGLKDSHCKLRTLRLCSCNLTSSCCEDFATVLKSHSSLKELDLSKNTLQDVGVKLLSAGLESSHCKLETLKLSACSVTNEGCSYLASALSLNPSHLKELDLSFNFLNDSGEKLLTALLEDSQCRLDSLKMTEESNRREIRTKSNRRMRARVRSQLSRTL